MLGNDGSPVEIDEAFIGGHDKHGHDDKAIIFGMLERDGDVVTRVVTNRSRKTVRPILDEVVSKNARIMSDEWPAYSAIPGWGYRHSMVRHASKEWVRGEAHTNGLEGFWSMLKRGINGTYIHVSQKHLPKYLAEFEFRHNLRKTPHLMLDLLLLSFPRP
jgi:transposase-like protein